MPIKPPETPPKRPGRPTRAEARAKALATLGIDPDSIDVRRILAEIAVDSALPAGARVQACRTLLALPADDDADHLDGDPPAAQRAIAELIKLRRQN